MPAIVRVKRRIDEEPLSAFVLNGKKRRRLAEESSVGPGVGEGSADAEGGKDEISTILKFAGTIKEQDDAATKQLVRLTKAEAKQMVQQKTQRKHGNHTERARQEMRQALAEQRFRVVNCMRTSYDDQEVTPLSAAVDVDGNMLMAGGGDAAAVAQHITILDIEKQHTSASAGAPSTATTTTTTTSTAQQLQQPTDSDTGYVYDLYVPENEQQAEYVDLMDDNYLSVRAFDLTYEDCYPNDSDDTDSEDSNQENYFGNEYPDEDEEGSSSDDDQYEDSQDIREMTQGIERFMLADDDDDENPYDITSSEDEDDRNFSFQSPYVDTMDSSDDGFVYDIDSVDVERYGMSYARYKARVLHAMKEDDSKNGGDVEKEANDETESYHSASENDEF